MKKPINITILSLALLTSAGHAALYINAGNGAVSGQGPTGADSNYLGYDTGGNETPTTGAAQSYPGTTFATLAGTYNVTVEITWPDNTESPGADNTKQSYGRANPNGYPDFFSSWVGVDQRATQGGIGTGTRVRLNLSGLEPNQAFNLRSYHFDSQDQSAFFTTSASGATEYEFGDADGVGGIDTSAFAYDYTLTTDATGATFIDYSWQSGQLFVGINGFDLSVVPEPSSTALFGLGVLGMLARRRRH